MSDSRKLRTLAVHAGQHPDPQYGCLAAPIYQTSTFAYGSFERGAQIFAGETPGYVYSRMANPTVAMLENKIAALEQAEAAIAFSSGTGAISSMLLALLNPGDEILFVGPLYGGTEAQLRDLLPRFGIRAIEVASADALPAAITPRSRMIYVETPMNPTLGIVDLALVAEIGRKNGLLSVADNTFATPILTQPITLGIDLSLHSATKYIGGHGDATGGIITGASRHLQPIRHVGMKQIGACMSPQDAYLFIRGAKTLALRVEQSSQNALQLAQFLQQRPEDRPRLLSRSARPPESCRGGAPDARFRRHPVLRHGGRPGRRPHAAGQFATDYPGGIDRRHRFAGLPSSQHHPSRYRAGNPAAPGRDRRHDPLFRRH